MERVEAGLLDAFSADGVCRVEFVTEFLPPFSWSVWLGTSTDHERDRLIVSAPVDDRIRTVVARNDATALYRGFEVESQETVDREYEGSWFYRLR